MVVFSLFCAKTLQGCLLPYLSRSVVTDQCVSTFGRYLIAANGFAGGVELPRAIVFIGPRSELRLAPRPLRDLRIAPCAPRSREAPAR